MDFLGSRVADQFDQLGRSRAADQRVVDDDHALAGKIGREDIEFHGHAPLAQRLGRLDEGASDIAVFDETVVEGDAGLSRIADGCGNGRIGDRHDNIRFGRPLDGELLAQFLPHLVHALAVPFAVGSGKINKLEGAARRSGGGGCRAVPGDFFAAHHDDFAIFHLADLGAA